MLSDDQKCSVWMGLFEWSKASVALEELNLKSHPHQQQHRSIIAECYKSNDSFDKVECCFDKDERCFDMLLIWQQWCRLWQQCPTKFRPFDKVITNWTCLICFDFVERTKFHEKFVRHCCRFDNKVKCCFDKVERCSGFLRSWPLTFDLQKSKQVIGLIPVSFIQIVQVFHEISR